MKILIVVFNYYPSIGGTQIFFQKIAEEFVNKYRDEVEVYTTDSYYGPNKLLYQKIKEKQEVINGVKITRFSFRKWHKKSFIFLKKIYAKLFKTQNEYINARLVGPWSSKLVRAMSNSDADIIIASSSTFMYMLYPLWRHKLKRPKPFIFQGAIHFKNDSLPVFFPSSIIAAMQKADVYWSNTEYETKIIKSLGIQKEKIKTVGIGIDLQKFNALYRNDFRQKHSIAADEILIVCLGRIDAFKGVDFFLYSLNELHKTFKNFKAIIAGKDCGFLEKLKKIHSTFSCEVMHRIIFVENISEEEKIDLCHSMNILVLPSLNESFGMVFLEAWACKKPVIGANIGAIASVISDGNDGLLFQPDNINSLVDKMLQLSIDKQLRVLLGNNGFKKAEENYTWKKVAANCRNSCFDAMENFIAHL